MYNSELPVPPAFIVTTQAYKDFLEANNIKERIYNELKDLDVENNQELQRKAEDCRDLILNGEMSNSLKEEILEAYDHMNVNEDLRFAGKSALDFIKTGRDLPYVAVRSSANAEDLPTASFAGEMITLLNVKGNKNLLNAVKECWASLFTARATYYRVKNNFPHEKVYIAVVVQKQIQSFSSGVMFTANPSTNNENEIVIEAAFGLGETVVSGQVTPDMYIVDKESLTIKNKTINAQEFKLTLDPNTNQNARKNLNEDEAKKQKLSDYDVIKLADIGKKIEGHYGKPQDIEFAIENSRIYIVQTRAITTLKQDKDENTENNVNEGKILLRGLAASPHIGSGKVKIVENISDLDRVLEGNVLVTKMTDPDMVPGMRRASAIVTDEGGATCFSGETNLLTNFGFMSIKDVFVRIKNKESLFVLGYDFLTMKPVWKNTANAFRRKAETLSLTVSQTGRSAKNNIRVTPHHKFFVFDRCNLVKDEIKEVIRDKGYVCLIDKFPIDNLCKSRNKLAYLVGGLMSDGYFKIRYSLLGNPRSGVVIFTQKPTKEKMLFIDRIKSCFYETFGYPFGVGRKKTSVSFIRGRLIRGFAFDYACNRLKPALILEKIYNSLDLWTMKLDKNSCLNLLAGFIDGDGCYYKNRLHIYNKDEKLLQSIVIACLKIGTIPQVTYSRTAYHIQIVENVEEILRFTSRVVIDSYKREDGTKFLPARDVIHNIDEVNYKGRIKPYVNKNLLIDVDKIRKYVLPLTKNKKKLLEILNCNLRVNRVRLLSKNKINYVYNIEVVANNESDRNYVVFTKGYSPLLVSNCHAAIVSRELGTACVVGTHTATTTLRENQLITVDGVKGLVYEGKQEIEEIKEEVETEILPQIETITKIKVNCDMPESVENALKQNPDGVGLLRLEFIIAEGKTHPAKYIKDGREEEYKVLIKQGIRDIVKRFNPRPVWVRTSDIRTDEYRDLDGGENEPKESNPMIGLHGIRRALRDSGILKAEIRAIKELYDEGLTNISIMLPFVISPEEVRETKKILNELNANEIPLGVMVETPAAVWMIEDICKEGISFISFGTNDLTQTVLAVDRNNGNLQNLYNELNPAVLRCISYVIKVCKKYNVETSICGQAGSNPVMAEFLVKTGIDSISANIDSVQKIRLIVSRAERKLMLEMARNRE